jgi:hypothetical protein
MALEHVGPNGVFRIPGAYPEIKVQRDNSGLATTGVVVLIGEAEAGPDFGSDNPANNYFGPTQLGAVLAKYRSGNLVDAYRAGSTPLADPNIGGSPSLFYLLKTNRSTKATGMLSRAGFGPYGLIQDRSYGALGNEIKVAVEYDAPERAPTTGPTTYLPNAAAGSLKVRVNGGAEQSLAITANATPATLVGSVNSGAATGLNGLDGILATGGEDRGVLSAALIAGNGTLEVKAAGTEITLTLGTYTTWGTTDLPVLPKAGDTLVIGATSPIKGATSANVGSYLVTAATARSIVAVRADGTPAESVAATKALAVGDLQVFAPVEIQNATGQDRNVLVGLIGKKITGTLLGANLKLTLETGSEWAVKPQVDDLVFLPKSAPAAWHAAGKNGGWYVVLEANSGVGADASYVVLKRLSNGAPAAFVATAIAATTDLQVLRPVIDGTGKSLEIYGDTDRFVRETGTVAPWGSKAIKPVVLVSAQEARVKIQASRSTDSISETLTAGGTVGLRVGYAGSGTLTLTKTHLTTAVTGGPGGNLNVKLSGFKSIRDLVDFLNSQPGYSAAPGSASVAQLAPTILDTVTVGIGGAFAGSMPGRIKTDAWTMGKLGEGAQLVEMGNAPTAGLPEPQPMFFLSGGAKGGTSNEDIAKAFQAAERLRANFVVPLFSRDASEDVAEELTDPGSTYQIGSVAALLKTHVVACSQIKRRRNRQGFLGYRAAFNDQKALAADLAHYRIRCEALDALVTDASGTIRQFHPWMTAVLMAAGQAAGFYQNMTNKIANASGFVHGVGDFDPDDDSMVEDALQNGLGVIRRHPRGGWRWVSDQTTYGADANFVYNSVQAVYGADLIALTIAERMENAFLGQSLADVSAGIALGFLKGIMDDLKRIKLTAASDDAPAGYRNAKIRIQGPAMLVEVEVKEATGLYFIPITAYITQVSQTAA